MHSGWQFGTQHKTVGSLVKMSIIYHSWRGERGEGRGERGEGREGRGERGE